MGLQPTELARAQARPLLPCHHRLPGPPPCKPSFRLLLPRIPVSREAIKQPSRVLEMIGTATVVTCFAHPSSTSYLSFVARAAATALHLLFVPRLRHAPCSKNGRVCGREYSTSPCHIPTLIPSGIGEFLPFSLSRIGSGRQTSAHRNLEMSHFARFGSPFGGLGTVPSIIPTLFFAVNAVNMALDHVRGTALAHKTTRQGSYWPTLSRDAENLHLKTRVEGSRGQWADALPAILWAYRSTATSATGETLLIWSWRQKQSNSWRWKCRPIKWRHMNR
ncbi:hypothetical protein CRG98_029915 [Punica granatum]|uniref:Uncharacterized protein n=1 Tax=Punica granatum TaxID=22663 RepID=A0A2I0J156_PUNGR|nr:hypothetical protein CRG98_029915 [Punica granatum]